MRINQFIETSMSFGQCIAGIDDSMEAHLVILLPALPLICYQDLRVKWCTKLKEISLHIGFFSPDWPFGETSNGIVTYVHHMRAALTAQGHRVSVLSPSAIFMSDGSVFPLKRSPSMIRRILNRTYFKKTENDFIREDGEILAEGIRKINSLDPLDVFEIEESFGWASQCNFPGGPPIIVRLHGPHIFGKDQFQSELDRMRSNQRIKAEGDGLAVASGITSPSQSILRETLSFYNICDIPCRAIANPIPISNNRWSITECDRDQILFAGRFDLRKGADIAIAAFSKARSIKNNLKLVMVGPDSGIEDRDGHKVQYEEYVNDVILNNISKEITFLGKVSAKDLENLRLSSLCTIVCSRFEVFPYNVAECMSIGSPVISTNVNGTGEMISSRSTGILVEADSIEEMADAIISIYQNIDKTIGMAADSYKRCAEFLDPIAVSSSTLAFYEEVILRGKNVLL